jgi:hypothetical protein
VPFTQGGDFSSQLPNKSYSFRRCAGNDVVVPAIRHPVYRNALSVHCFHLAFTETRTVHGHITHDNTTFLCTRGDFHLTTVISVHTFLVTAVSITPVVDIFDETFAS